MTDILGHGSVATPKGDAAGVVPVDTITGAAAPVVPQGTSKVVALTASDSPEMLVDGSETPVVFSATPSAGKAWFVAELVLQGNGGAGSLVGANFVKFANGLQTGLTFTVRGTDWPFPLGNNRNLAAHATSFTTFDDSIIVRFTLADGWGRPEVLAAGETVAITVADDITTGTTGLDSLYAHVRLVEVTVP